MCQVTEEWVDPIVWINLKSTIVEALHLVEAIGKVKRNEDTSDGELLAG